MQFVKFVAVIALLGALGLGFLGVYVADSFNEIVSVNPPAEKSAGLSPAKLLKTDALLGKWVGKWGRDLGDCVIEIDRVEGSDFYGTLSKNGAKIALKGTLEWSSGAITLQETKIIELGEYYGNWSLGNNTAVISDDRSVINGKGTDSWGEYSWFVSRKADAQDFLSGMNP